MFSPCRQADKDAHKVDSQLKEQGETLSQVTDQITETKALAFKENKLIDQQNQQNEKLNDEIRSVLGLIAFEEAKLLKEQVDE